MDGDFPLNTKFVFTQIWKLSFLGLFIEADLHCAWQFRNLGLIQRLLSATRPDPMQHFTYICLLLTLWKAAFGIGEPEVIRI